MTVAVGYDRFTLDLILAKARASGIEVWPLTMDENGLVPGFAALAPHKIMVKPADVAALQAIVDEVRPGDPSGQAPPSRARRLLRRVLGSFRL